MSLFNASPRSYDESTNPSNGWTVPQGTAFDDMENDLAALSESPAQAARTAAQQQTFRDQCRKCNGTGRYRAPSSLGTQCFACDGKGYKEYKTSPEFRANAKAKSAASKKAKLGTAVAAWVAEFAEEHAWIQANDGRFDFATAMQNALAQYGFLTPGQLGAVRRCIESSKARAAAKAVQQAAVVARTEPVQAGKLEEAFAKASSKLKWPKITLAKFTFTLAGANSRNPGAIYVKQGRTFEGTYLGMVKDGAFRPARDCTPELQADIIAVLADPKAAAVAHGLMTGECCICSRELTDPVSVANGIGPICAGRFGW